MVCFFLVFSQQHFGVFCHRVLLSVARSWLCLRQTCVLAPVGVGRGLAGEVGGATSPGLAASTTSTASSRPPRLTGDGACGPSPEGGIAAPSPDGGIAAGLLSCTVAGPLASSNSGGVCTERLSCQAEPGGPADRQAVPAERAAACAPTPSDGEQDRKEAPMLILRHGSPVRSLLGWLRSLWSGWPLRGVRIGEAAVPAPQTVKLVVANVTSWRASWTGLIAADADVYCV